MIETMMELSLPPFVFEEFVPLPSGAAVRQSTTPTFVALSPQKPGRGTSDNPTIREILNLLAGNVGLPEAPAWFPLVMKPCERGRRKGTGI